VRQDLTEAEIRQMLLRCRRASEGDLWRPADYQMVLRMAGELQRLRDREASVMHLHEIEGAY